MSARRGSVLVEGVMALSLIVLIIPFIVDAARRSQYQAVFHRAAFVYTRHRTLGKNDALARRAVSTYLKTAFGLRFAPELKTWTTSSGRWASVHLRFAMLHRLQIAGQDRHHLEVTEKCLFPY